MEAKQRTYLAIDLKTFYASVECVERRLDPLKTNLVVADSSRTEKTICLAVSPSLKAYGIPGRARLFEVMQKVREVNGKRLTDAIRQKKVCRNEAGRYAFASASFDADALAADPALELSYITATPRMALYMEYSTRIYNIYLKYVSAEDIHVYSIDECFIDVTTYLPYYHMTAHELSMTMIRDVLYNTGITATAGIGTNLYLAKVAMDIEAKHVPPDKDGVRIAELDEYSYRQKLWAHTPLTDFWRVGPGYARRLESLGLYTMGDIALCSVGKLEGAYNEDLLYGLFGVNAELLIDHAWGWEPCTIAAIKAYKPKSNSIGTGQVLHCPYDFDKTRLIVREMTDLLVLDLVDKGLVTDQIDLTIGYDIENLKDGRRYDGPIVMDRYGRRKPKHAHGTVNLEKPGSSSKIILEKTMELYEQIMDKDLLARRVNVTANHVVQESAIRSQPACEQLDLFTDHEKRQADQAAETASLAQEKKLQQVMLRIKKKYGKNAILKGMNFEEGATTIDRNEQIGGHKA